MSSDTYRISATRTGPTTLSLTCETTTVIGPNDMATSRSFVLLALHLALPPSAPLSAALEAIGFGAGMVDEGFHREHVGAFIAWTRLVRRENIVKDVAARYQLLGDLNAREASGDAPPDFDVLEELWKQYPPHRFVLEARVTEPRWLEGLPSWFATTAYDVWESDPMVAGGPDLVRSPWTSVKTPTPWLTPVLRRAETRCG